MTETPTPAPETITEKANRLAREAVKHEMGKHQPIHAHGALYFCSSCLDASDEYDVKNVIWPCQIVKDMQDAEEAISMAEEAEARAAGGPYYCGAMVRTARLYGEYPEPAEYCEEQVEEEGEPCPAHDEYNPDNGPDKDDYDYDRYKDERLGL